MKADNKQKTTFWNFIKEHTIEIPIIQRDYAQGRIGKEKLREKFLSDIKNTLDNKLENGATVLTLDFVYGSVENNRLNPLDGQQRLTTLWLLHWYIAYKAGKLQENTKIFKRFTYETRTSSREFCNKLSEFVIKDENIRVIELIQNQTWFFSAWKQDPTIQAMLNMISGTSIKDKKENEIIDGFDEIFTGTNKERYVEYWKILTSNDCPITFYYLDLLELTLSDDLYIKMNARGKQLTNFENFKADLVNYIDKENIEQENIVPENSIAHKFDTKWTDIFWKYKSPDYKIDEIYYLFLNRFILNKIITQKDSSIENIESNKLFKYLYGKDGDDRYIKYNGFDIYKSNELTNAIISINNVLDNFYSCFNDKTKTDINKLFFPSWNENDSFRYVPEYKKEDGKFTTERITQFQRVVFHAISCYFEKNNFIEDNFKQWMRVVWNIVENANINTIQAMIGAMHLIDDLSKYANNIYEHLKGRNVSKDFAKEQMEEEKEKAKQILIDTKWEEKIIEAEKTAFFKGAIRFLFRTNPNEYDWGKFDKRFEKAKKYFNNDGVNEAYLKNAILLRLLISYFDKWEYFNPWDKYKTVFYYDNNKLNWKNILTHIAFIIPVNKLFDNENSSINLNEFISPISNEKLVKLKKFHEDIVKTVILSKIASDCTFHWWNYGGRYSLYPYNTKSRKNIFVLADKRNAILSKLVDNKTIECNQKIDKVPFFWGWEINFTLKSNNKEFQWWNSLKEQSETGEWKEIPEVTLDKLEQYLKKQK